MRTSESLANIGAALSTAMGEIENVEKNKAGYGYKYADLAQVLEVARPIMAKHGIAVVQAPHNEAGGVAVTTRLIHSSGEWIEETLILPVETTKNLSAAQASGVVITYARRYSLAAMLGIAQEDTDAAKPDKDSRPTSLPEPKRGTRVVDAVLDGVKIDETMRDEYVAGIKAALFNEDFAGLGQLLDEVKADHDMKVAIWSKLDSKERRVITDFEAERRSVA